ncbi:hypothetical protein ACFWIA_24950 [Streptomyces sp. NPDC127068]|uniref:hypothetical protein n=1 Tax=Streptomyces sp. NPDC127068 TaxID=3347127 RepID=UPI00365126CE
MLARNGGKAGSTALVTGAFSGIDAVVAHDADDPADTVKRPDGRAVPFTTDTAGRRPVSRCEATEREPTDNSSLYNRCCRRPLRTGPPTGSVRAGTSRLDRHPDAATTAAGRERPRAGERGNPEQFLVGITLGCDAEPAGITDAAAPLPASGRTRCTTPQNVFVDGGATPRA